MRCSKSFLNHHVRSPFLLLLPSFPCTFYISTNLYFPHLVGTYITAPLALATLGKVSFSEGALQDFIVSVLFLVARSPFLAVSLEETKGGGDLEET